MPNHTSNITDVERHVGLRIRERRIMLGLTQQQLADLVGITYQQAHKYERGINRVSAGRLYELATVLGVDVGYFFEGLGTPEESPQPERQRMSLDLARNFARIGDARQQEAIAQLTRVLADQTESPTKPAPEPERTTTHATPHAAASAPPGDTAPKGDHNEA